MDNWIELNPMTATEFNEKYSQFLKDRFYGCQLTNQSQIKYLDDIFMKELIWLDEFKYLQIKNKFRSYCFYAEGVPEETRILIEVTLKSLENE